MFDSCLPWFLLTVKYESDPSFHIKTYVYRVITPVGKYIVHLERYVKDTYVVKFFPARLKQLENKFNIVANDHMMQGVVGTALQIFAWHWQVNRRASLGFVATPSILGHLKEERVNNQRFRIYKKVMQNVFGEETFSHFVDVANSAYLMVNKANAKHEFTDAMQHGFSDMYPTMFDLSFTEL